MADGSRPAGIVVYLRRRLMDEVTSDAAMSEQRAMLSAWLDAQATTQEVLREFTEEEGETAARPALARAVAFCKAQETTLVIVSTEAIGAGLPFDPRIASVPIIVLPQPKRPTPSVIPLPAKSRDEISLYAGAVQNGRIPVYLCNPKLIALKDVIVAMGGMYTDVRRDERWVPMSGSSKTFARIEPLTAQLIETRDMNNEGESIDQTHIRFDQGGEIREGIATLYKLFDPVFIAVKFVAAPTLDGALNKDSS